MAQIFPKSFNWHAKTSIVAVLFLAGGVGYAGFVMTQNDYWTNVGVAKTQPIQFSHAHHVNGLGIDCRYCHTSAEHSNFAGIPPTKTCMNCHQQIWTGAPMLEPVRESYKTGKSLEWERIHRLGDFAYFDHSVHVNQGIGCSTCHGRVDLMQAVYQKGSLLMIWCLECHRAPEKFVRPKDQIFNHAWTFEMADPERDHVKKYGPGRAAEVVQAFAASLPADLSRAERERKLAEKRQDLPVYDSQTDLGNELVEKYKLRNILECSGCHR